MELGVFGLVDHAHAAATELLQNAVVGNGPADHVRRPTTKFREERPLCQCILGVAGGKINLWAAWARSALGCDRSQFHTKAAAVRWRALRPTLRRDECSPTRSEAGDGERWPGLRTPIHPGQASGMECLRGRRHAHDRSRVSRGDTPFRRTDAGGSSPLGQSCTARWIFSRAPRTGIRLQS